MKFAQVVAIAEASLLKQSPADMEQSADYLKVARLRLEASCSKFKKAVDSDINSKLVAAERAARIAHAEALLLALSMSTRPLKEKKTKTHAIQKQLAAHYKDAWSSVLVQIRNKAHDVLLLKN